MQYNALTKKWLWGLIVMNAGVFMSTSAFAASTIWVPTDLTLSVQFGPTAGGIVAMFDDDDAATGSETTISGSALTMAPFDLVTFPANGSDFDATNLANNSITLTDTKQFVLGFSIDGGFTWLADTAFTDHGNNSFTVEFTADDQTTYVIDVEQVIVPVPAAFWLFGSGLLGLTGIAKRRRLTRSE